MSKLNQEIKTKWLEALRSGAYNQGKGCLKNKNCEYCCLGVLADVLDPTLWNEEAYDYSSWGNPETTAYFQHEQAEQYDIEPVKTYEWDLMKMNDSLDYSFEQIADWIEENL